MFDDELTVDLVALAITFGVAFFVKRRLVTAIQVTAFVGLLILVEYIGGRYFGIHHMFLWRVAH